jgi:hypothetical protein
MKWNWGTKLMIAMAAFMVMVIIFVVLMMRESVSLVEKNYYPKGQTHQELIDKKRNAVNISEGITVIKKEGAVSLVFPEIFDPKLIKGSVHMYHRIDDTRDWFIDLIPNVEGAFDIKVDGPSGRYIAKIDWSYEGTDYYVEKSIDLP